MALFFDDLPSTSVSTPKSGHDNSQMTEDTDLSRGEPSDMNMSEIREQPTGIDDISKRVQELVEKINDSRTSDQKVMDNFQEKIMEKVSEMFQQMKERMYTVYEDNSNRMQVKLQELTEVLESCSQINHELLEASQALASLREGLAINQTAEPSS